MAEGNVKRAAAQKISVDMLDAARRRVEEEMARRGIEGVRGRLSLLRVREILDARDGRFRAWT